METFGLMTFAQALAFGGDADGGAGHSAKPPLKSAASPGRFP